MQRAITKINCILIFFASLLALVTVWIGVEKARTAYALGHYKNLVQEKTEFITKLETEKALLLSPDRLKVYAKRYNLAPATTGQVRILPEPVVQKEEIIINLN